MVAPEGSFVSVLGVFGVLCALLVGCSSDREEGDEPEPNLVGDLCVDPEDACCCAEEIEFAESGVACSVVYPGDPFELTIELVTRLGGSALRRVGSASECTGSGGWFIAGTEGEFVTIDLCEATCSLRKREPTTLRVLRGCPPAPC